MIDRKNNFMTRLTTCEQGATVIEYGLIAALIAVAAIASMGNVGTSLNKQFENVEQEQTESLGN